MTKQLLNSNKNIKKAEKLEKVAKDGYLILDNDGVVYFDENGDRRERALTNLERLLLKDKVKAVKGKTDTKVLLTEG